MREGGEFGGGCGWELEKKGVSLVVGRSVGGFSILMCVMMTKTWVGGSSGIGSGVVVIRSSPLQRGKGGVFCSYYFT